MFFLTCIKFFILKNISYSLSSTLVELPNLGQHLKDKPTNPFVDSPVTSENGSTSGISGSGSSNGSDTTLVNAEETYTSSLFQTEPLYQFYDANGSGSKSSNNKVRICPFNTRNELKSTLDIESDGFTYY